MSSFEESNEVCTTCEFHENLHLLREIPFFSGISLETLKVFAYLAVRETFAPGEVILRQGEDDGQALYLVSGQARLLRITESGERIVRDYGEGDFLGGLALMGQMHRLFSLVALTKVNCLILHREKFSRVAEKFPDVYPKLIESIATRVRAWEAEFVSRHDHDCPQCFESIGVSLI